MTGDDRPLAGLTVLPELVPSSLADEDAIVGVR
jgi:hypothetical protein